MARQQCPACQRHYEPPGPCKAFDPETGGECGYIEPPRTKAPRPATRRPTSERPSIPSEGYALTGEPADPRDHLAIARDAVRRARERKEAARKGRAA